MLIDPAELARFEASATNAGATFVERMLMDTPAASVARFHRRGQSEPGDPWHEHVRTIVAAQGGDAVLAQNHAALEGLLAERPDAVLITSSEGAIDQTYRAHRDVELTQGQIPMRATYSPILPATRSASSRARHAAVGAAAVPNAVRLPGTPVARP
ncbi:MAG: hypothetical protein ACXVXD_10650 [Nocardioidaceae bacterium]